MQKREILKSTWQSITSKPKIIELAGLAGTGKSTLRKALKEIYPEAIYSLKGDGVGFFLLKNTLIYRKLYIQGGYDLFKVTCRESGQFVCQRPALRKGGISNARSRVL